MVDGIGAINLVEADQIPDEKEAQEAEPEGALYDKDLFAGEMAEDEDVDFD